jgi:hypothetical protein
MNGVVEFLEARIGEDEKTAKALLKDLEGEVQESYAGAVDERGPMTPDRLLHAQMWAHYDGQSKRRSFAKGQQIADLASPDRALAECAAKRAIIELAQKATEVEKEFDDYEWRGAGPEQVDPWTGDAILFALAAVYKDHPDYQQEWANA